MTSHSQHFATLYPVLQLVTHVTNTNDIDTKYSSKIVHTIMQCNAPKNAQSITLRY